jgi:hypothetical protein
MLGKQKSYGLIPAFLEWMWNGIMRKNQVLLSQKTNIEQKGWIQTTSKEVRNPMSNTINLRIAKPNPENKLLLPITGTLRYLQIEPDLIFWWLQAV